MLDGPERATLQARVRFELDAIKDPCSVASGIPIGLDEVGLIDTVTVDPDGRTEVRLRLTSPFCHMIGFFKVEADRIVTAIPGITALTLTADNGLDWSPSRIAPAAQARRAARLDAMMDAAPARRSAIH